MNTRLLDSLRGLSQYCVIAVLLTYSFSSISSQDFFGCWKFDSECNSFNNDFADNCIDDWISTHGTPHASEVAFMGLWKYSCEDSNFRLAGEGIALNEVITGEVNMSFSYRMNFTPNDLFTFEILALSNPLPADDAADENCNDTNNSSWNIPNTPSGSTVLYSQSNAGMTSGSYIDTSICLNIPSNVSQIWIRPTGNYSDFNGLGEATIRLSNFCLSECDSDPCADIEINAEFGDSDQRPPGSNFSVYNVTEYEEYEDLEATHTWLQYVSQNPNGPFTQVAELTIDDFPVELPLGFYHTMIHRVSTICGEDCWATNICRDCSKSDDCSFCGIDIDCSDIPEPSGCELKQPTDLECVYSFGKGSILDWSDMAGALGYRITFAGVGPNQGTCTSTTIPGTQYSTVSEIPAPSGCYRWRVQAECGPGIYGPASGWKVFGDRPCKIGGGIDDGGIKGKRLGELHSPNLSAYPNPSSTSFNLRLNQTASSNVLIEVFEMSGRKIHLSNRTASDQGEIINAWTPSAEQKSGIYLLRVTSGESVETQKVIYRTTFNR